MGRFDGRVALVTGATSGIGRITAIAFAREGAKVVVTGRREAEGLETVKQIESAGGEGIFLKTDAVVETDTKRVIAETLKTFGRLDFAFNNAGVDQSVIPITETSEGEYDTVMDINVKGVFFSMKHEIPAMLKSGGGVIINNASIFGLVGVGNLGAYVASKHAVVGLTKAAALELAQSGIRVNAVAPGATETDMIDRVTESIPRDALSALHPVGRLGKPEEIAAAVLWLCDPSASFVTGQILAVDGGFVAQ